MSRRLVVVCSFVVATVVGGAPAAAQERTRLDLSTVITAGAILPPVVLTAGQASQASQAPMGFERPLPRNGSSALMTSLYASTAVMQALDVHSTLLAIDRGGVEANPLMAAATRNRTAFIALKAGVTVSTVMAARHMSKRNKIAAALTLVAVNSAYAMIINHNYNVARKMR